MYRSGLINAMAAECYLRRDRERFLRAHHTTPHDIIRQTNKSNDIPNKYCIGHQIHIEDQSSRSKCLLDLLTSVSERHIGFCMASSTTSFPLYMARCLQSDVGRCILVLIGEQLKRPMGRNARF